MSTATDLADDLDRIANHISETLYFAGSAIKKAHTQAEAKFIRHDDYDRLRQIARELRGEDAQAAHELGRKTLPWGTAH